MNLIFQRLEENSAEHGKWEHDLLILRQALQASATRDMQHGLGKSAETLSIEAELSHVQQKASEFHGKRNQLLKEIQALSQREDFLTSECIRPSPTGVVGAEPLPSKKVSSSTWFETDMDSGASKNLANAFEQQLQSEMRAANSKKSDVYINTYEATSNSYENYNAGLYDDEVQTVHSEGMTSEVPPLPQRGQEEMCLTLGDISEADDRVKKFYGIIPKDKEIKTVRMVKRDSKERTIVVGSSVRNSSSASSYEDESDLIPGLNPSDEAMSQGRTTAESSDDSLQRKRNIPAPPPLPPTENGVKTHFVLGEYSRRKTTPERPGSSLSAHERLFGTSSKESSLSPQCTPRKNGVAMPNGSVASGPSSSEHSAMVSPVFKSAAAKAIIEEVGKNPRANRKVKKRSFTITSSQPAVLEALNEHNAKL